MGFLMAVRLEIEVSRAEQLPALRPEAELVRWKATRAAQRGRTACDWSRLVAADLTLLAAPIPPAQRGIVGAVNLPEQPDSGDAVREQVRRCALRDLKPWLDTVLGQTVDCMPAQLRALPEELRGPALALVVRQQTAGPNYELGIDSGHQSPRDMSLARVMGIPMLSKAYAALFPSVLTREMLVREGKLAGFLAGPVPLPDDHDVRRIARALGFRLD
jgi:hypothetical protein